MSADEPQQHSTVYRSYQSFRFPFAAADDSTSGAPEQPEARNPPPPAATTTDVPPISTLTESSLNIPIIESAESSPRGSFVREAEHAQPVAPVPPPAPSAPPDATTPGNSPRGILSASSLGRGDDTSPNVSRAPPRALPRRASMVSFRLQRSNSVTGSAAPTPREFAQPSDAPTTDSPRPKETQSPSAVADHTPLEPRAIPLPEPVEQSTPPTSSSQLGGNVGITSPIVRPAEAVVVHSDPLGVLEPSASTAPTRTPSVEPTPVDASAVAAARQPSPKVGAYPAAAVITPREPSSGVPTPRSIGTPSNRGDSPSAAPVVPKRAAPQLVAKFQEVVRQKLDQERKAAQVEEQRKKDEELKLKEEERRKQAEADQKKMDLLLELQQAHDDQLKHIEEQKYALEFQRQAIAAERDALNAERQEFENEKISLMTTINSERAAIQQEWYALSVEVELLQKRKELLESNGAPSGHNWRGESTIKSPSRDDFKRIDPMVLRDLLQQSPHGGAFSYEPPEQLPRLTATSRAASSSLTTETKFSEEELSRADALHRFERWRDPIRFKQDGRGGTITQQVHHHQEPSSPLRIEYQPVSSKVSPHYQESILKTPHSSSKLQVEAGNADEYVEVTTTPNFRLFPRKGRM